MKIFITGAGGMLGRDLVSELQDTHEIIARSKSELDITDTDLVYNDITSVKPDVVINCAAFTKVDDCEKESEIAFAVNAHGVKNIALACKATDSTVYHISTDFVFDGRKRTPYRESDETKPLCVYGKSKLEGEKHLQYVLKKHVIIRTMWLYGKEGNNFVSTILKLSQKKNELKVVNDQEGTPTCTVDLSQAIKILIDISAQGIYHVSNRGSCTWYEYAVKLLQLIGSATKVSPITSKELSRPAVRPAYSVLNGSRFLSETGYRLRHWEVALDDYIHQLNQRRNS